MTIFDTLKYQLSEPPTLEELRALPTEVLQHANKLFNTNDLPNTLVNDDFPIESLVCGFLWGARKSNIPENRILYQTIMNDLRKALQDLP